MEVIDTNKYGLTIYYEPLGSGGGIYSILDEDYNILVSDAFAHSRAYAIQLAREDRRELTEKLKEKGIKPKKKRDPKSLTIEYIK